MMRRIALIVAAFSVLTCKAWAAPVTIDLSGAGGGHLITAPGGSFGQAFVPQWVSGGTGLGGSPSDPLTLDATGWLEVDFFDPALGFGSENSILPYPGNQGPLALKLDSYASSISWVMGYVDNPGFTPPLIIKFYDEHGGLVDTITPTLIGGYSSYSFTPTGAFLGLTISNDNDPAGMRFMHFAYDSVASVPDAASSVFLLSLGLLGLAELRRRSR